LSLALEDADRRGRIDRVVPAKGLHIPATKRERSLYPLGGDSCAADAKSLARRKPSTDRIPQGIASFGSSGSRAGEERPGFKLD
jgi:hypothetical protein